MEAASIIDELEWCLAELCANGEADSIQADLIREALEREYLEVTIRAGEGVRRAGRDGTSAR